MGGGPQPQAAQPQQPWAQQLVAAQRGEPLQRQEDRREEGGGEKQSEQVRNAEEE